MHFKNYVITIFVYSKYRTDTVWHTANVIYNLVQNRSPISFFILHKPSD